MSSKPRKPAPKPSEEPRLTRGRTRPGAIFPVAPPASALPETYAATLQEIKTHLRNSRIRAILAANPIVIEAERTSSSPSMPCAAWTNPSPSPPGRPNSRNPSPRNCAVACPPSRKSKPSWLATFLPNPRNKENPLTDAFKIHRATYAPKSGCGVPPQAVQEASRLPSSAPKLTISRLTRIPQSQTTNPPASHHPPLPRISNLQSPISNPQSSILNHNRVRRSRFTRPQSPRRTQRQTPIRQTTSGHRACRNGGWEMNSKLQTASSSFQHFSFQIFSVYFPG
jgi:hypothetical protein